MRSYTRVPSDKDLVITVFNVANGRPNFGTSKPGGGAAPKASKRCVACGQCATVCPVGAIPPAAPNTTTDACIGCMRCAAVCPQKARDLPAPMKLAVGTFLKASAGKPKQPELFL